jgi:hypothetical protein
LNLSNSGIDRARFAIDPPKLTCEQASGKRHARRLLMTSRSHRHRLHSGSRLEMCDFFGNSRREMILGSPAFTFLACGLQMRTEAVALSI